jgi:hypothetical protein
LYLFHNRAEEDELDDFFLSFLVPLEDAFGRDSTLLISDCTSSRSLSVIVDNNGSSCVEVGELVSVVSDGVEDDDSELFFTVVVGVITLTPSSAMYSGTLKKWTVPVPEQHASTVLSGLKVMEVILAGSVPLLNSATFLLVRVLKTRIIVPLMEHVASKTPFCERIAPDMEF